MVLFDSKFRTYNIVVILGILNFKKFIIIVSLSFVIKYSRYYDFDIFLQRFGQSTSLVLMYLNTS